MSVSYRRHPNASGLDPTEAQRATAKRWAKRHPNLRGQLTPRGRIAGLCSILVKGLDPDSLPTFDSAGYVVAWHGLDRGWVRLDSPINPDAKEQ